MLFKENKLQPYHNLTNQYNNNFKEQMNQNMKYGHKAILKQIKMKMKKNNYSNKL